MAARAAFPCGLKQPESSYKFGLDALLLAALAREVAEKRFEKKKVIKSADLGAGCGAAALAFALSCEKAYCLGLEREGELVKASLENAAMLGLKQRVNFVCQDIGNKGEIFQIPNRQMDIVLANPPWHKAGRPAAPELRQKALHGGNLDIFVNAAARLLAWHGFFCLIIPPGRFCEICLLLDKAKLGLRLVKPASAHAGKAASRLLLLARKDAAHDPVFAPALVLYDNGQYSREALTFCPWLAPDGHS